MIGFDHTHYVPILRWKQAERSALKELSNSKTTRMTPLIELVPDAFTPKRDGKRVPVEKKLSKIAKEIFEYWGQAPCFVDLWHLQLGLRTEDGRHPLKVLREYAQSYRLFLIPVTGLNRDASYQSEVLSLVTQDHNGVCIRLLREDLQSSGLSKDLKLLLNSLSLRPEEVDLLVDYQIIDKSDPTYAKLCTIIPVINRWRTFTVVAGTFPQDLSNLQKNSQYELERLEWLTWRDQVIAIPLLPRRPTYGDYTVQHPKYVVRSGFMNFSGSIRYTHENYWVIMRGEGVFNTKGPGFAQWPANALLLCDRDEFCGSSFSCGDKYIKNKSLELENPEGIQQPGSASTWLQAGINHHLTFVLHQIASLFEVSFANVP